MKSLFTVRCTIMNHKMISPSISLKLFDQLISPILMYGAEIWANEIKNENNSLEQICNSFYRFILGVSKVTPIIGIKGELGRIPISIKAEIAQIKYCYRLCTLPQSHILYYALKEQIENNTNWIKHVYKVLGHNDLSYINDSNNINSINHFSKTLKIKLTKDYIESWREQLNKCETDGKEGNKLRTYRLFKKKFDLEDYLMKIKDFNLRKILSKFRLSDHNLAIELGRRIKPKIPANNRLCKKCDNNVVEDEMHFILDCDLYSQERMNLFYSCNLNPADKTNREDIFIHIVKSSFALASFLKSTIFKSLT